MNDTNNESIAKRLPTEAELEHRLSVLSKERKAIQAILKAIRSLPPQDPKNQK